VLGTTDHGGLRQSILNARQYGVGRWTSRWRASGPRNGRRLTVGLRVMAAENADCRSCGQLTQADIDRATAAVALLTLSARLHPSRAFDGMISRPDHSDSGGGACLSSGAACWCRWSIDHRGYAVLSFWSLQRTRV